MKVGDWCSDSGMILYYWKTQYPMHKYLPGSERKQLQVRVLSFSVLLTEAADLWKRLQNFWLKEDRRVTDFSRFCLGNKSRWDWVFGFLNRSRWVLWKRLHSLWLSLTVLKERDIYFWLKWYARISTFVGKQNTRLVVNNIEQSSSLFHQLHEISYLVGK